MKKFEDFHDHEHLHKSIRALVEAADRVRPPISIAVRQHGAPTRFSPEKRWARPAIFAACVSVGVMAFVAFKEGEVLNESSDIRLASETDDVFSPYESAWPLMASHIEPKN